MSPRNLFRGLVVASLLSSSIALAHVSLPNGPAQADKSGTKITFGIGHGCDVGGVHYDTYKVRVIIPAGMSSVRPLYSDFGKPTITKTGTPAVATEIEWTKDAANILAEDDGYYEITIRAKIPNAPYTQLPIVVHQVCRVNSADVLLSWDVLPPGTGNTAPVMTIVPQRLNATGWNKFTIPAGTTVPAAKLGTFFGDAQIVWKGTAAFSTNSATAALITTTAGVTALGDLVAGDEIWVKY
jgi:uncharacterized protein YcnI